jgi:hypothetical protein
MMNRAVASLLKGKQLVSKVNAKLSGKLVGKIGLNKCDCSSPKKKE